MGWILFNQVKRIFSSFKSEWKVSRKEETSNIFYILNWSSQVLKDYILTITCINKNLVTLILRKNLKNSSLVIK
jgi:hypothetical protein